MAISKKTLREHLNQVITLEFAAADRAGAVLAMARNDLKAKAGSSPRRDRLEKLLTETQELIESSLAGELDPTDSMIEGASQGLELTLDAADVPKSSLMYSYQPILDLAALAQTSAETLELVKDVSSEWYKNSLDVLQVSIAQGEGTAGALERILGTGIKGTNGRDGTFRSARFRAEAIARTSTNELINKGKLSTYDQLNSDFPELKVKKEWDNVEDRRTSDICMALTGQVRGLNEPFTYQGQSFQAPPAHPFCRSTIIPRTTRYNRSWEKQAAKVQEKRKKEPPEAEVPIAPRKTRESLLESPFAEAVEFKQTPESFGGTSLPEDFGSYIFGDAATPLERDNKNRIVNILNQETSNTLRYHDPSESLTDEQVAAILEGTTLTGELGRNVIEAQILSSGYTWEGKHINVPVVLKSPFGARYNPQWEDRANTLSILRKSMNNALKETGTDRAWSMNSMFDQGDFNRTVGGKYAELAGTYVHELGHKMHGMSGDRITKQPEGSKSFSRYSDVDPSEWVAEHFVQWAMNPEEYQKADPVGYAAIEQIVQKAERNLSKLEPFTGVN